MLARARLTIGLILGGVLAAVAVGPALAADTGVTIQGFAYSPGAVTVTVGDTVTWTNLDGASHTATADDGSFDTGGIPGSSTDTIRFTTAGEFRYHCTIHPDMTGRVIVQEASSGGTGATPPTTSTAATTTQAEPAPSTTPTLAFALLAIAATAGALGWHRRTGRARGDAAD